MATRSLCDDDVTPLAVTSQSPGRPASSDAMMFSICNEKDDDDTPRCRPTHSARSSAILVMGKLRICQAWRLRSFHEPEQLCLEDGASLSQLQLSGTHCHFTFAPRPSVAVSFEQGSRLISSSWSFTDFSSEKNY